PKCFPHSFFASFLARGLASSCTKGHTKAVMTVTAVASFRCSRLKNQKSSICLLLRGEDVALEPSHDPQGGVGAGQEDGHEVPVEPVDQHEDGHGVEHHHLPCLFGYAHVFLRCCIPFNPRRTRSSFSAPRGRRLPLRSHLP